MTANDPGAFLDRLVARAVGKAEVVEPRLLSLFEPMRTPRIEESAESLDDAPVDAARGAPAAPSVRLSKPEPSPRAAADPRDTPVELPRPAAPTRSFTAVPAEPRQARGEPALAVLAIAAPSLTDEAPPGVPSLSAASAETKRRDGIQTARDAGASFAPELVEPPRSTRLPFASRFAPLAGVSSVESTRSKEPRVEKDLWIALPGEPPSLGALLPLAVPSLPSLPSTVPRSRGAAGAPVTVNQVAGREEPVVNVTIGRVEVRAVTEAARAARPKPPSTGSASLEDYLKTHARGR